MKKIMFIFGIAFSLFGLHGCQNNSNTKITSLEKNVKYSNEYSVGTSNAIPLNVYGIVKSDNIKKIINNTAGTIDNLNCQIGQKVNVNSIIATINPDFSDPNYQNLLIQQNSLKEQLINLENIKQSTLSNVDSQINQLQIQINNNNNQIDILNSNIENLQSQKSTSASDIQIQIENLKNQLEKLNSQKSLTINDINNQKEDLENQLKQLNDSLSIIENNKEKSLQTINNSINNLKNSLKNTLNTSYEFIDKIYGITDNNKNYNDDYENYLSAKNSDLKSNFEKEYKKLLVSYDDFSLINNDDLLDFLEQNVKSFQIAKDGIINSISNYEFSQSIIDTYYGNVDNIIIGLLEYKSNLNKLLDSYETTKLNFDSQINSLLININSLEKNLDNINKNKIDYSQNTYDSQILDLQSKLNSLTNNQSLNSDLSYDSNLNSLKSQINNLETSNNNILEQIKSIGSTKESQIKQIDNQIVTINQNIQMINNNIQSETLKAGINGVIKTKFVDKGNKVPSYTSLCEIVPDSGVSKKLEIYSPTQLYINQSINIKDNNSLYITGKIDYEFPNKSGISQNYIYESYINLDNFKDGEKIQVYIQQNVDNEDILIPLEYISPKIDGYFVVKKNGFNYENVKVEIGYMNSNLIQIQSGLNNGDIIVR